MLGGHPDQAARNARIMTSNYEKQQQANREEKARMAKVAASETNTATSSATIVTKDLKVSAAKPK